MTDEPLAHYVSGEPSGLTNPERMMLLRMAMLAVAEWSGWTLEEAADALDELAGRGDVHIEGDRRMVTVTLFGKPIVGMGRTQLRGVAFPRIN